MLQIYDIHSNWVYSKYNCLRITTANNIIIKKQERKTLCDEHAQKHDEASL